MSSSLLIVALIGMAFACAFGLCEWLVRRPRSRRGDDRLNRG